MHPAQRLGQCHQRVGDRRRVGLTQERGERCAVPQIAEHEQTLGEVVGDEGRTRPRTGGQRRGELVGRGLAHERRIVPGTEPGPGDGLVRALAHLLDHERAGKQERVLRDAHAENDRAPTAPEVDGIDQGDRGPGTAGEKLRGRGDGLGDRICQHCRHRCVDRSAPLGTHRAIPRFRRLVRRVPPFSDARSRIPRERSSVPRNGREKTTRSCCFLDPIARAASPGRPHRGALTGATSTETSMRLRAESV